MCDDLWTANARIAELEAENLELRHTLDRANSYAEDITIPNIDAMCEKIKRLEAVADAAENYRDASVLGALNVDEFRMQLESKLMALDAADCDIKRGGE